MFDDLIAILLPLAISVGFFFAAVAFMAWLILWVPLKRLLMPKVLRQILTSDQSSERKSVLEGDEKLLHAILHGLSISTPLTYDERIRVVELAGKLRLKETVPALVNLLKRLPMWEGIHAKAIWALGEIGDEKAAPELVPYIGEFNHLSIRIATIEALHKLGWGEFADAFNRLVFGNDEALSVLGEKYRRETIKALVRALWANKVDIAVRSAQVLGKLNAVEALKELKRRSSPLQSPKEIRDVCREIAAKLEQISRLPSPARTEIDTSTLPRPADPTAFQTETLPSPANLPKGQS